MVTHSPGDEHRIAGFGRASGDVYAGVCFPETGGGDVKAVAVPFLHDLGVTRDNLHTRFFCG